MQVTLRKVYSYEPMIENHLALDSYRPAHLVNQLREILDAANDSRLAEALQIPPAVISKLRGRKLSLSPALLLRIHDAAGLPIDNIRDLAGIPAPRFEQI